MEGWGRVIGVYISPFRVDERGSGGMRGDGRRASLRIFGFLGCPRRPGHTPFTSLRLFAPLSFHERGDS